MSFFGRLFGGKGGGGGDEPPAMPWDQCPSILEFVRAHTPADGPGMSEDGYTLPDEDRINQGSKIRWAAGAWDGVTTHHMGQGENEATVRKTVELVLAYSRQPTAENKAAVYRHVIAEHMVSIIDPVIEALVNEAASTTAGCTNWRGRSSPRPRTGSRSNSASPCSACSGSRQTGNSSWPWAGTTSSPSSAPSP